MKPSYLIKPALNETYPEVDYGKGVFLFDKEGNDYLDACSGAVTANIGHGVDEIISVMHEQAKKVSFVYRSQFTSDVAEQLATKIAEMLPGDLNWSFFVNSGSEATETALKIAIQYWQEKGIRSKTKILSRWISYHGITLGALSMSGHPGRRARFVPLLQEFPAISPPYCYRCPYKSSPSECGFTCAEELEVAIKRIGAEQIAAFIAEPIIGAAGAAITPPEGYYRTIKRICEENDILFIADEVMTGLGRTGTMLACEQYGVIPDIVALGKGMGAGYAPIGAAVVSDRVIEPISKGSQVIMSGHTLSANPQSCAASLAVLEFIEKEQLLKEVVPKGTYLKNKLDRLKRRFPFIGEIRGKGLLIGLEFVKEPELKQPFDRTVKMTDLLVKTGRNKGILLYPAGAGLDGLSGDAIILAPPLTITKREIDELIRRLEAVFIEIYAVLGMSEEN